MNDLKKISILRTMANRPVEETFRGILRISNYSDLIGVEPDVYLNQNYYGESNSATWNNTEQDTHNVFGGAISRFIFGEDSGHRSLKLPVTDSRGYFLNLFLGESEATIGINANIGEINNVGFPIIKANKFYVGVLPFEKNIIEGDAPTLNVLDTESTEAKLIIHSQYSYENGTQKDDTTYTTVFKDSSDELSNQDVFIFNQEYLDKNTNSAYVYPLNIQKYIEARLDSYFKNNIKEVPSGMIINHYSDLSNWYCPYNVENTIMIPDNSDDKNEKYAGYRPSLYHRKLEQSDDGEYLRYNTEQGVANGSPWLKWENKTLIEIVPEYKRDYVLCDGKNYTFYLVPQESARYPLLNRFYNLFHCIGYFYTNTDKDKEVLYEGTMAAANAFKALDYAMSTPEIYNKNILDADGLYDITKAKSWLSARVFGEIPNCLPFESTMGGKTSYSQGNISVNINNKLITNFNDTVKYYNGSNIVSSKIIDMPEVQKMLTFFGEPRETWYQKFSTEFNYTFAVPNLITNSDIKINSYTANTYGLFIGFNGLMGATEIKEIGGTTIQPVSKPYINVSFCDINPGDYPHVHATTMGIDFETYNNKFGTSAFDNYGTVTRNNYISADYAKTHNEYIQRLGCDSSNANNSNYFLYHADSYAGTIDDNIVNGTIIDGIPAKEYSYSDKPGLKWYGRTSGPINVTATAKDALKSAKSSWSTEYFFRPENVRVLPLIKL